MICDNCKNERLVNDFINNHNICYKCEYRKKIEKIVENRTSKNLLCRICGTEIIRKGNLKKVFCSPECAKKGNKETRKNYWTNKIKWVG